MRRAAAVAAVALFVTVPAVPARASAGEDPLEQARNAAQDTAFSGHVVVQWQQGSASHREELEVKGKGGAFVAEGGRQVMGMGDERLVYNPSDGWHEVWPSGLGEARQPPIGTAYDISRQPDSTVAGKATSVFALAKAGVRRETLELDKETRLLLRRQQFDRQGQVERSFEFTRVTIGDLQMTAPTVPPTLKHEGPQLTSVDGHAPGRLANGYQRLGAYQRSGVTQLLYGDGLYDLSLFVQQGRLEPGDLPAARTPVRVNGREAWMLAWPSGDGVVWAAGPTVYTLLGDGPPDELLLVANSVPVHRSTSIVHRLRQACRGLVQSFTGGR